MTDDHTNEVLDATRRPGREPERDHILQILASSTAQEKLSPSLTLTVQGTVISGVLVSQKRWHELLVEESQSSSPAALEFLEGMRDAMQRRWEEEAPSTDPDAYGFLHLAQVRLLTDQGMLGGQMLWRVRISEVSGWTFQQMT